MFHRPLALACLAAFALLAAGCLKAKQQTTVNPDGSGKMQITFGVSEQNAEQMGDMPFTNLTAEDAKKLEDNGFVAFSKPEEKTENGYKYVTVTGYFMDVNNVKFDMGEGDPDQKPVTFSMEEGKLTVNNSTLMQMAADASQEQIPEEQKPMMKTMLEGMEITETYDVPGEVNSAEPYMTEDGMVMAKVTVDDLLAAESPTLKKLAGAESLTIMYEPMEWEAAAKAEWTNELQQAKAEWAEMKAQAKSGDDMNEGMQVEVEEPEMQTVE